MQITRRGGALLALAAGSLIGGLVAPSAAANGHHAPNGNSDRGQETAAAHQAEPASGGASGREDRSSGSGWTEDNDTNDRNTPNNVADDGDNAHPSGNDRSVERGKSGNQGKTASDPDDDGRGPDRSNAGPDKPNGSGGDDKADQDGNNGCGNDDDFEDDNEGWCGKRRDGSTSGAAAKQSQPEPKKSQPKAQESQPKAKTSEPKAKTTESGAKAKATKRPASGNRPTGDNVDGKGTSAITVVAECHNVTVTSSKDISNVVVTFVDGTTVKFDGLTGTSWSKDFADEVAGATAKSATTRVTDMATCGEAAAIAGGEVLGGAASVATCPAGSEDMNGEARPGGCRTPHGQTLGAAATASRSPAARADQPFGGAPLGAAAAAEPGGTVSARSAGGVVGAVFSAAVGGALAATGGNPSVLVMIALGLLVAGVVLVITGRGFGIQGD